MGRCGIAIFYMVVYDVFSDFLIPATKPSPQVHRLQDIDT